MAKNVVARCVASPIDTCVFGFSFYFPLFSSFSIRRWAVSYMKSMREARLVKNLIRAALLR